MPPAKDREIFRFTTKLPVSVEQAYAYHSRPGALQRLLPPWQDVDIIDSPGTIVPGTRVKIRLRAGVFKKNFIAHHTDNVVNSMFRDIQEQGPFRLWEHSHYFESLADGCVIHDQVEYSLPLHPFLPACIKNMVRRELTKTFEHRARVLRSDLALHSRYSTKTLRILVSGASGVLGRQLVPLLRTGGHTVWTLVRRDPRPELGEIFWDPDKNIIDTDLPELDSVIHLAGEYIGLNRWTEQQKARVLESRIRGTELLAKTIANQPTPPESLLCASAIGYYGDSGVEPVNEENGCGKDFISTVCRNWEKSTDAATQRGIRTVLMRLGVGMTPAGGALKRTLGASKLGCIRCCGDGEQFVSWISLDDMIGAILHILKTRSLSGPVNIASPNPVTNAQMMKAIARVIRRPLLFPVPASILRLLYGQMAREILLSGCRADVQKLIASGYTFRYPHFENTLQELLGKSATGPSPHKVP